MVIGSRGNSKLERSSDTDSSILRLCFIKKLLVWSRQTDFVFQLSTNLDGLRVNLPYHRTPIDTIHGFDSNFTLLLLLPSFTKSLPFLAQAFSPLWPFYFLALYAVKVPPFLCLFALHNTLKCFNFEYFSRKIFMIFEILVYFLTKAG